MSRSRCRRWFVGRKEVGVGRVGLSYMPGNGGETSAKRSGMGWAQTARKVQPDSMIHRGEEGGERLCENYQERLWQSMAEGAALELVCVVDWESMESQGNFEMRR